MKATLPAVDAPFRWRTEEGGPEGDISWIEASLSGAVAAFTTRIGGCSRGTFATLNLGMLTDDERGLVASNRATVAGALERDPYGVAMGLQVHGNRIQVHRARPKASPFVSRTDNLIEADAQLTDNRDVTPLVLVADCVPLILSAPHAIGAVHCGWRGVAAGMVGQALESLCALAEAEPTGISAVMGPAIGACCYEVGEEVIAGFGERGLKSAVDGRMLDLPHAIRLELTAAGVDPDAIDGVGICTSCNPELFYSHRRDGPTGRQAGIAWLS